MMRRPLASGTAVAWTVGTLLLLSACGGTDYTYPPLESQIPQRPAAGAPGAPAAPTPPSVAALPSPAAPVNPPQDVQQLVGLKGEVLRKWMGDTVFIRHDGIAEIWRFAADTCFLDVFLYREPDGLRVAHLDARARQGTKSVLPQTCYGQILAQQRAS
ncbi:MAG: hypothetical protein JO128_06565 [Alphaproteobacteria bacterium]|nr:hypothetical protein [Alphaproteobacteria bacterium]